MSDDGRETWVQVSVGGREQSFPPGTEVLIGRDDGVQVVVDDALVSRTHARLTESSGIWTLEDVGSRNGLYCDGARESQVTIDGVRLVRLGDAVRGAELRIEPVAAPAGSATHGGTADAVTVGGSPPDSAVDRVLRIRADSREYEFPATATVTIGRAADCDIQIDNPLVSRQHARASFRGDQWVLEDLGSRRGTFWDGRKVERQVLGGAMTIWIGPEESGEKVVFVTSGDAPHRAVDKIVERTSRTGLLIGAAVIALVAVVVAVIALVAGGGGGGSGGGADLAAMRRATVRIEYDTLDDNGQPTGTSYGSGTIISDDGLILTNAHVAAPSAPGSGVRDGEPAFEKNPKWVRIYMNTGGDEASKYRYRARTVAADGYLDLAVLKVFADKDGKKVDGGSLGLPSAPVGKLAEVHSGDDVYVLGYPLQADSYSVNVTKGVVGSRVKDDTGRAPGTVLVNVDARINGGNSGGLAADRAGEIIGVPSYNVRVRSGDPTIGQIRPVDLAGKLIAAARAGKKYDAARWFVTPSGDESVTAAGFAVDADACGAGNVATYSSGTNGAYADFVFAKMTPGEDLNAFLADESGAVVATFPFQWKDNLKACQRFDLTTPDGSALPSGTYRAFVVAGPNYDQLLARQSVAVR